MSDGEAVLAIEGLVKHYGKVEAVRGIDLEVRRGEVFGFLGPNGSGKSTTHPLPARPAAPDGGSDQCLRPRRDARRRRASGAGSPTSRASCACRIGSRPSTSSPALAGCGAASTPGKRDALAERLRLDLHRPLRDLSTGNRRKVALLLAFLADAELLVLDEPTNGLDPLMQHEFLTLVREARTAGTTVLLSSHDLWKSSAPPTG